MEHGCCQEPEESGCCEENSVDQDFSQQDLSIEASLEVNPPNFALIQSKAENQTGVSQNSNNIFRLQRPPPISKFGQVLYQNIRC